MINIKHTWIIQQEWFKEKFESYIEVIENELINRKNELIKKNKIINKKRRSKKYKPSRDNKVYFIQASNGLIKIGKSRNPKKRLKILQTGSPIKLKILGVIDGGIVIEQCLHTYFKYCRKHGEWFSPDKKLIDFINGKYPIFLDNLHKSKELKKIFKKENQYLEVTTT